MRLAFLLLLSAAFASAQVSKREPCRQEMVRVDTRRGPEDLSLVPCLGRAPGDSGAVATLIVAEDTGAASYERMVGQVVYYAGWKTANLGGMVAKDGTGGDSGDETPAAP